MYIVKTIQSRVSCRSYGNRPVEADKIAGLTAYLKSNTAGPFGVDVRFALLNFDEMDIGEFRGLGTYGVIRGARQFIVGAVRNRPGAMEDYGYAMEKNILTATSMGLGTCWLGGTFNRAGFAGKIKVAKDELLPAVTPVGYPADSRSLIDRLFRFSAGSDNRKPWDELFYEGNDETALTKESTGRYATPLECVRIGPSASNKQPWRIIRDGDGFHFYVRRTPGYDIYFGPIRLQNIDMGIAMCHFELSSREAGLHGRWIFRDPQVKSGSLEYVASWVQQD